MEEIVEIVLRAIPPPTLFLPINKHTLVDHSGESFRFLVSRETLTRNMTRVIGPAASLLQQPKYSSWISQDGVQLLGFHDWHRMAKRDVCQFVRLDMLLVCGR